MAATDRVRFAGRYSATALNKSGGKLLDKALEGAVQITRREQRFVLIREEQLAQLIDEAGGDRPQSLDDLLRDYDAAKIKKLTRGYLDDPPKGKEML
jgi:hypothetical protein